MKLRIGTNECGLTISAPLLRADQVKGRGSRQNLEGWLRRKTSLAPPIPKPTRPPRAATASSTGQRLDVEQVPRLPTFPARWVLDDPRKRQYVVFWVSDDGDRCHAIQMAPTGQPDSVVVTFEKGVARNSRSPLPRGMGMAFLYRCPGCQNWAGTSWNPYRQPIRQ
jgi:hypothetical protein